MVYCNVYNCKNHNFNYKGSFFRVPTDPYRQLQWLWLIGRMEWADKDSKFIHSKRVCSMHFEDSMYAGYSFSRCRLTNDARPTIFQLGTGYTCFPSVPPELAFPRGDINAYLPNRKYITQEVIENIQYSVSEQHDEHVKAEIISEDSGSPFDDLIEDGFESTQCTAPQESVLRKRKLSSEEPPVSDDSRNIFDVKDICRLCLQEEDKDDMYPIYSKENCNEELIPDVMKCIPVQVDENDDRLPKHVCKTCYKHMLDWFLFCEMCRSTDVTLKQFVNNVHVTEKDSSNKSSKRIKIPHIIEVTNDCDEELEIFTSPKMSSMTEGTSHSSFQLPEHQIKSQIQIGIPVLFSVVPGSDTISSMSTSTSCYKPSNTSINISSIESTNNRPSIKNSKNKSNMKSVSQCDQTSITVNKENHTEHNSVTKYKPCLLTSDGETNKVNNNIASSLSDGFQNRAVKVISCTEYSDLKNNKVTKGTVSSISNVTVTEDTSIENDKFTENTVSSISNVLETCTVKEDTGIENDKVSENIDTLNI